MEKYIEIKGARVNNLKNVSLKIPRDKFIVITGVSGSGKSSLAFDTLYAEGQRRYVESLSSYARQYLGRMCKPECDFIKGLPPAIAIEQKVISRNPRSTVGTTTEIYEYLRLLFARIGHTYSPISGNEVKVHTVEDVIECTRQYSEGTKFAVLSPLTLVEGRDIATQLSSEIKQGYSRIFYKNEFIRIDDFIANTTVLQSVNVADIFILIDRMSVSNNKDTISRLTDSVETAFYEGNGSCRIVFFPANLVYDFSTKFEADGMTFEKPNDNMFSFNSPAGACPECEGYGKVIGIDENLVIPNSSLSVYDGCVQCWHGEKLGMWMKEFCRRAANDNFPIFTPYFELTATQKAMLWHGLPSDKHLSQREQVSIDAFFQMVKENQHKIQYRVLLSRYRGKTICPKCHGTRLRPEATWVKIGGMSITELIEKSVDNLKAWFDNLVLEGNEKKIAERLLHEITSRLQFLQDVGLGYLTLNRPSNTLSGGESQRINLTTNLGSSLVGSVYILDEPSIGLHPANIVGLTGVMHDLVADGNSVILVDHDTQILKESDWIIEMGPEAGAKGGRVIAQGTVSAVAADPASQIGPFLSGAPEAPLRPRAGKANLFAHGTIRLSTSQIHTVKPLEVAIPKGRLTVVTGVSGSGKTTMVLESLIPALEAGIRGSALPPHVRAVSAEGIAHVKLIDATPIGINVRSTVATYAGVHDELRKLYARSPDAKARGCKAGDFSYNTGSLRCPGCDGTGVVSLDVQFLPDVSIPCPDCRGSRYARAAYDIQLTNRAGQSVSLPELMDMDVNTALPFCADRKTVSQKLQVLQQLGLGYLTLGEETPSLSGGEAQRLKLASEIGRIQTDSVFVFDEPSIGLHPLDVRVLLGVFQALLDRGATVVVIEHDLDVIRSADYVIDMGPGGGDAGGRIVAAGTPEEIRQDPGSITGRYL